MEPQLLPNYVIKKRKKINSNIGDVIIVVIWNVVSYNGAECEKTNLNRVDIGFCDCWILSLLVLVDLHIWWMRLEHCSYYVNIVLFHIMLFLDYFISFFFFFSKYFYCRLMLVTVRRVNMTLMMTWREKLLVKLGTQNVMENDDEGATQKKMDLPFYWLFYFWVLSLCDLFIFETYVIVTIYYLFSKPMWLLHYITLL